MPDRSHFVASGQASGFTLIEILVVVAIISITVTFAVLSFGDFGHDRSIVAATEELAQTIALLHEKALFESSTLKMDINSTGYRMFKWSVQNSWVPLNTYPLHPVVFSKNTRLERVDGQKNFNNAFTLTFDASGDMTPFALYFGSDKHPHLIKLEYDSDGKRIDP